MRMNKEREDYDGRLKCFPSPSLFPQQISSAASCRFCFAFSSSSFSRCHAEDTHSLTNQQKFSKYLLYFLLIHHSFTNNFVVSLFLSFSVPKINVTNFFFPLKILSWIFWINFLPNHRKLREPGRWGGPFFRCGPVRIDCRLPPPATLPFMVVHCFSVPWELFLW